LLEPQAMPLGLHPSAWHPALYALSVLRLRVGRHLQQRLDGHTYAATRQAAPLEHRVFKHTSKLLRHATGAELALQLGKVANLRVAVPLLSGVVLAPGETFSFCRLVGRPTRTRGFVDGLELASGVARPGVGGGLCQAANLLHWLVLHSPLTLVERHAHSFDPFPDDGRVLPFGSGATIFYNYRDLRFRNDTAQAWQVRLWLTDKLLEGELRCQAPHGLKYRVYEERHRFFRRGERLYRANELWREVRAKGHDAAVLRRERLHETCAEVKYAPGPGVVVDGQ
jgi:vancomycin resistance protein VanW